jgi:hypothetical protein
MLRGLLLSYQVESEDAFMKNETNGLQIQLEGLELQDIEVFLQEGSRGIPDFAASSGTCSNSCNNSCHAADL